ncbi:hypothetical protein QBC40DRAFT_352459 [Triangularia verruculosa]|uniref:Histidine-specific methyltransferase SAM-dependent domain-containing protein n=1 Tax=Triangularia verruculosa TaxID=2587418 RepID=A0AAN6X7R1_9PEZI|nr:hypothetical protein QBC40DRAFT_352459 [Triangularia verruculosa]
MAATTLPPFNALVAESISQHSQIPPEQIIVLDNSDKYCPDGIKTDQSQDEEGESLAAIFGTMAELNKGALLDKNLCTSNPDNGGHSFRSALLSATDELANLAQGRKVRYVELGPEPFKSSVIITHLINSGVHLSQYVGIDINPESELTMRAALEPIIGPDRFAYLVADFYKTSADDLPPLPNSDKESEVITVMTNLGFQEGNDLPSRLGPMLSRLTRPGDLLLSEMQVLPSSAPSSDASDSESDSDVSTASTASITDSKLVEEFYHHPEMLKFSSLVGKKFDRNFDLSPRSSPNSSAEDGYEYIFQLVPLQLSDVGEVAVATTLVSLPIPGGKGKNYVLTNSCIKYTREQFARARETQGKFGVKGWRETGDGSVVFQIAERRH